MWEFVVAERQSLADLWACVEEVKELEKKCVDMYAEKAKTPIGETLAKFALFRKDMDEARRQNLLAKAKKEKAEKKRLEQEARDRAKRGVKAEGGEAAKA